MSEPEIRITCHPDGTVTVEVNGVTGPGCRQLTKPFEEGLGAVMSVTPKKEMFTPLPHQQHQRTRN